MAVNFFMKHNLSGFQCNETAHAHMKLNVAKEMSEHAEGSAA